MAGMVHHTEVKIAQTIKDEMDLPDDFGAAMGAFTVRLKDEIHKDGVARGLPMPDINKVDTENLHKVVEYIFPHYFLLPFYGSMSSYRIRPLTPETCFFEIWSLTFIPDDDPNHVRPLQPTVLAYDSKDFPEIPQQDYSNLPLQQLGLHAGGFDYMRLSNKVEGLISNYQRLIDGYLGGVDKEKLLKATQSVNSTGFETTVQDIGI